MRKNWRGGAELLKNGTLHGYAYYPCYSRPGFTLREALGTVGFLQHLPAKYRLRPKKVLPSERGALALCLMVNPAVVNALRSLKG